MPDHKVSPRTILYLCYGRDDLFDQTLFSILSLLRRHPAPTPFRIAVYTDNAGRFARLPVEIVTLTAAQLEDWLGGSDYIHRRKTSTIDDALERFGGKVIFLDSDTYFTGSVLSLFDRVGPGRACFHLCEGYLAATGTPFDIELYRQLRDEPCTLPGGSAMAVDQHTLMWNTGVVGVDVADRALLLQARDISDEIWRTARDDGPYGQKIHHAEQFAMGFAFRRCQLNEAADLVYHYWPPSAKMAFGAILHDRLPPVLANPSPQAIDALYATRYRETGLASVRDSVKMAVRAIALKLGIRVKGVRRSVR
jgi:hypothetical protein